ncbi:2,3-diketo-l-gulonate reductase [Escherichia coli]|nr:2,3-diketo-l-gulonate reductase [Escherichia coli]
MKVTFEQLKAAFNRVLISRGVDSETADACAECSPHHRIRRLFSRR